MKKAIYPGTFDPITLGHVDIIARSLRIFDELIVAVARNEKKRPMFSLDDRVAMIRDAFPGEKRIIVRGFEELTVDFAAQHNISTIIRGLRAVSDFEYEFQIALTNRQLNDTIETIFMMPSLEYVYLNSTIVRELASMKTPITQFVTPNVEKRLRELFEY